MTPAEISAQIERRICHRHNTRKECEVADCDDDYELKAVLVDNIATILSALRDAAKLW